MMRRVEHHHRVEAVIEWLDPQPRRMTLIAEQNALHFNVDGRELPMVPRPYRCIELSEDIFRRGSLTVTGLAKFMGMDASVLRSLLTHVPVRSVGRIVEVRTSADEILIRSRGESVARGLARSSGGERAALVCDLAVILADMQSEVEPTILVLDTVLSMLDPDIRAYFMDILSSADRSFQTIALDHPRSADRKAGPEWLIASLEITEGGTRISQMRGSSPVS